MRTPNKRQDSKRNSKAKAETLRRKQVRQTKYAVSADRLGC